MSNPSQESHDVGMPVDFVTFNWWIIQTGYGYHSYIVGEYAADDVPNSGIKVTGIKIIDRDLAEVKFENDLFVFVKNLNTYGTKLKDDYE